jgi:hypothetical protein
LHDTEFLDANLFIHLLKYQRGDVMNKVPCKFFQARFLLCWCPTLGVVRGWLLGVCSAIGHRLFSTLDCAGASREMNSYFVRVIINPETNKKLMLLRAQAEPCFASGLGFCLRCVLRQWLALPVEGFDAERARRSVASIVQWVVARLGIWLEV